MTAYTLTPGAPAGAVFAHTGGTLEVIISKESDLGGGAEVTIQYETSPGSSVYKTLPGTDLTTEKVQPYSLSAGNYKAVLVGGYSAATVDVRLVSVA